MTAAASPDVAGTVFEGANSVLARNYAAALLGASAKQGGVEPALAELDEIVQDVWRAQPKLAGLLVSPSLPHHEKDRLITKIFEGRAQPLLVRFLKVLNRQGRLSLLPAIAAQARAEWDRRQGRRPVTVRSAVPLDQAQQDDLRDRLHSMMQATPIIKLEVDPDLIGGLVIQIGDHIYDASVRAHLEQLRRRLVEEKVHDLQVRRAEFF